jgi:hypothetical protein
LEEKLAVEEAALLNEEARMNQEEEDLHQFELDLQQREQNLISSNGTSTTRVLVKSESFVEPPPSYDEVTDTPPAFEDLQPQVFPELDAGTN